MTTRQDCLDRDAADPLGAVRDRFSLPQGVIYLDGNSLGALPVAARDAVQDAVERQWGGDLIASWNKHGWIGLPQKVGGKIARLIGAEADEVVAADSVSVNLFKLAAAAVSAQGGRRVVLTEGGDFPTDLYILQGLAGMMPEVELRVVAPGGIGAALDERVTVVLLSHVHYRSGAVRDMAGLNAAIRAAGALSLWDLSHSAGVLDVDLNRDGADLAAGCGYKYLNGGPGAPAFLFVARRHQAALRNPLSGWMGHARPFDFIDDYTPAPGIDRWLCGTPPILSLTALSAALDAFDGVDMKAVRARAGALGDLFIERVEARCAGKGLVLASPRDATVRGGQVAFTHPQGWAVMQNLIARGVIGDFRAPDVIRFGFAPLYVRRADVWDSVEVMGEILDSESWREARFQTLAAVT
ncbi:kynureninase [Brevundimonas denitrificans]|uniref:Kynureninase n=1 Tax=Brevundimonas denitrificans TaxID=1443434 RepID=A0ABQ6BJ89_9CAUL|nr:kynureninase [Brevundimonas denitrificans]GLS01366.1 kynureninase [Brevundimonas denitrificans]